MLPWISWLLAENKLSLISQLSDIPAARLKAFASGKALPGVRQAERLMTAYGNIQQFRLQEAGASARMIARNMFSAPLSVQNKINQLDFTVRKLAEKIGVEPSAIARKMNLSHKSEDALFNAWRDSDGSSTELTEEEKKLLRK